MVGNRNTKRALLTSILSVVLCCAMLIGSTFAWFTDSVTSSGNIIKSGTLDVTMEWANGTEALDSAAWKDASKGKIFDYDKWEPGYTEARHIRVTNNGSLALKYQLQIAATGEAGKLAEVIDVYAFDNGKQITSRDDVETGKNLGTLAEVLAGNTEKTYENNLSAGKLHYVTIALKMQEDAGNDYQKQSIGSDFAIKLLATQYTEENDSFGNDYDADADWPLPSAIATNTTEDLRNVLAADGTGRALLTNDIFSRMDDESEGSAWSSIPIYTSDSFIGSSDGAEKAITSRQFMSAALWVRPEAFAKNQTANLTLENIRVKAVDKISNQFTNGLAIGVGTNNNNTKAELLDGVTFTLNGGVFETKVSPTADNGGAIKLTGVSNSNININNASFVIHPYNSSYATVLEEFVGGTRGNNPENHCKNNTITFTNCTFQLVDADGKVGEKMTYEQLKSAVTESQLKNIFTFAETTTYSFN